MLIMPLGGTLCESRQTKELEAISGSSVNVKHSVRVGKPRNWRLSLECKALCESIGKPRNWRLSLEALLM